MTRYIPKAVVIAVVFLGMVGGAVSWAQSPSLAEQRASLEARNAALVERARSHNGRCSALTPSDAELVESCRAAQATLSADITAYRADLTAFQTQAREAELAAAPNASTTIRRCEDMRRAQLASLDRGSENVGATSESDIDNQYEECVRRATER